MDILKICKWTEAAKLFLLSSMSEEMELFAAAHTHRFPLELRICMNSISNIWAISLITSHRLKRKVKEMVSHEHKRYSHNQSSSNYMLLLDSWTLYREAIKNKEVHWWQTRNPFQFLHGSEQRQKKIRSEKVQRQPVICQRPCKGTRRNIKGDAKCTHVTSKFTMK